VKRRELLAGFCAGSVFTASNAYLWQMAEETAPEQFGDSALSLPMNEPLSMSESLQVDKLLQDSEAPRRESDTMLDKVRFFEHEFDDDVYLDAQEHAVFQSVVLRLERIQKVVGHGNFNVLGFDDALAYARGYNSVGAFAQEELTFIEKLFFTNSHDYGFFGDKVSKELTDSIAKQDVIKVPYSGHYLFKGESVNYYEKLKSDIGHSIILTSGIRSNVKQLHLFLGKARSANYNLSKASRSLAPPGHSYHGIGDFDVGRVGWGGMNFTGKFAETDEFKRMQDLGYVQIRYTEDNRLGVRFEPWHIKVV